MSSYKVIDKNDLDLFEYEMNFAIQKLELEYLTALRYAWEDLSDKSPAIEGISELSKAVGGVRGGFNNITSAFDSFMSKVNKIRVQQDLD